MEEKSRFVSAWISAQIAEHKSPEYLENEWAVDKFIDLPYNDPEETWELIRMVLETKPSDEVMAILAAGPLEDLMTAHGENYIQRVETEARQNPAFRRLMQDVWLSPGDTPIQKRFYEAACIDPPFKK